MNLIDEGLLEVISMILGYDNEESWGDGGRVETEIPRI